MKNAFTKFASWIKTHLPTKRRLIQVYAALLFNANLKGYVSGRIYTGKTKYACVPGMNCYSCPGAVGSCPLGSLQNALASSGNTAPYYVIGIIALFGLILGRTICGYLCPVGLGQELLYKLRTPKLKKSKFTRILSYLKYVLLIGFVIIIPILYGQQGIAVPGFCKYVCPAGTFGGGLGLLLNPNNQDYLAMLGPIFTWKFCLLMVIMMACVFCYRSFCRFLCPLGAIYGFFNRFAFIGVHVDKDNCTDCGLCVSHCKMDIRHVGDHECINCGECVSVCPTKAISWKGSKLFLRHNEVEGATDSPVPGSDVAKDAPAKLSVTIDGLSEIRGSIPFNRAALEGAGVALPMLMPDTGLPQGDSAPHDADTSSSFDQNAQQEVKPAKNGVLSSHIAKSSKGNDASGAANKPASAHKSSGSASLAAKVKTPKFIISCVAILLAIAILVGAFVYFNVLQTDPVTQLSVNETYCGTYLDEGGVISVDFSSPDIGHVDEATLAPTDDGLQLSLTLSYEGDYDGVVTLTYSAALAKTARDAQLDGVYSGVISLESNSIEGGHHTLEDNGVKNFAGESVRALLNDGNIALQLGNEGMLSAGMLIPDFTLRLYEMDAEGNYSYTTDVFHMYDHLGEVVVVNFWGTWCGPCVAELPDFELLKQEHPEITVLAIHGDPVDAPVDVDPNKYVCDFIKKKEWKYISFAQDVIENHTCQTFKLLGGKDSWPITLIIDKWGRISFVRQGKLGATTLFAESTKLL